MATFPCPLNDSQVQEAFLLAPPLIAQQILNLTVKHPNFLTDIPEQEEFPLGNGTTISQLIFRGAMPQIERGFDKWKKLLNNTGCDPCAGPDCSYNWTQFGGNGIERKEAQVMERDFKSPAYCIKQIQTTAHFEEVFAQIVQNLYAQVAFFKEQNVSFNALTSLTKKYIVDSGGAKPNIANPYIYPNVGTVRLSALNIDMLEFFYEYMRRIPDAVPYDVVNGSPIFSLIASHQTLARLYRDDPQLRQDVRFSGLANALVEKYNFMSTIRGMFIAAPILYPRRFNIVAGEAVEVLPFVNGIPMEVGSFTGFNPSYEAATHEEVLVHGKFPFKIFYMPTAQTLGQNTSFGPEFSWFNSWKWVNPETIQDPFRREGYFATSAAFAISQQFSDGLFSILVERVRVTQMASFNPEPTCPPDPVSCDNEIDGTGCPCPLILSWSPNLANNSDTVFINLAVPTDAVPTDTIQFGIDTGGYLTGTVENVSDDGLTVEVTLNADPGICDHFTTIFCDNTLGCYADVVKSCVVGTSSIQVTLSNPIKADANNDVVTVTYADGSTEDVDVNGTPDLQALTWVLDGFTNSFTPGTCAVPEIVAVCVPTATDATCPGCGGPSYSQCAT